MNANLFNFIQCVPALFQPPPPCPANKGSKGTKCLKFQPLHIFLAIYHNSKLMNNSKPDRGIPKEWATWSIFNICTTWGNFQPFSWLHIPPLALYQMTSPPACSWLCHENKWGLRNRKETANQQENTSILAYLSFWSYFFIPLQLQQLNLDPNDLSNLYQSWEGIRIDEIEITRGYHDIVP